MIHFGVESPFGNQPIKEIPLPDAPLAHVVAQVRFPKVFDLASEDAIKPIHRALSEEYPVFRKEHTVGLLLTADGVTQHDQQDTVWRLQSKLGDWQVSLSTTFVALDTSAYTSRADFCQRLEKMLSIVREFVTPAIAERVGIRYVDRVYEPEKFVDVHGLVRPTVLAAATLTGVDAVNLNHSLCESLFSFPDEGQLLTRWGVLPKQALWDPTISAVDSPSWILDLDAFRVGRIEFEPHLISTMIGAFSERVYRFFRWSVSDEFLRLAGAEDL